MSQPELKVYKGNCHCGAFKFELNGPVLPAATACNCSICSKKGYLWLFPSAGQLRIITGDGTLSSYEYGTKTTSHKFCSTCGTGVMALPQDPSSGDRIRINARMLLDVDAFSVQIEKRNCEVLQEVFNAAPFTGDLPQCEGQGLKTYTGGCHCGAITLAVKTKPLPEIQVKVDNCSICQRNANICIYPHRSQVSIPGTENTVEYMFGRKFTGHRFCKICGVQVYMTIHGPPKALFDSWPEARKEAVKGNFDLLPVRIAVLDDVEWEQLNIERTHEGTQGYAV